MNCRVCGQDSLQYLWDYDRVKWFRCLYCGSDSSDFNYSEKSLVEHTIRSNCGKVLGPDELLLESRANLDWFLDHPGPDRTFLDIGCCEGTALKGMQDRGYSVHGFDVIPAAKSGDHVTIAPKFAVQLFPRQYGSVLCRETIEHVPDWWDLLREAYNVLLTNGIFQIQTPRPLEAPDDSPLVYQQEHLQLFCPIALRHWLEKAGFAVLEFRTWNLGQAAICKK